MIARFSQTFKALYAVKEVNSSMFIRVNNSVLVANYDRQRRKVDARHQPGHRLWCVLASALTVDLLQPTIRNSAI
jgi:hypothetical protein